MTAEKGKYTFAGNCAKGLLHTITVISASPSAAEKAAKQRLTNPRLIRVG